MFAQPGKKMLFMGDEFGQMREWAHDFGLEWHELEYPYHRGVQGWVEQLNRLYRTEAALHELDTEPGGFEWIDCNDNIASTISLVRSGKAQEKIVIVCNFTPVPRMGYRLGVPAAGFWRELLNSDAQEYGGSGLGNMGGVQAEPIPSHGRTHSITLTLPPLAAVYLKAE
jgi:1,4-alpha-glucan branching enzyme